MFDQFIENRIKRKRNEQIIEKRPRFIPWNEMDEENQKVFPYMV